MIHKLTAHPRGLIYIPDNERTNLQVIEMHINHTTVDLIVKHFNSI